MPETNKNFLDPEKWVSLHADYLFNFTITRLNDRDLAKDLVQDTFFSALKAKDKFKGEASERTWLIAILKRKIVDYYRKINSAKGRAEIRINFYADGGHAGEWLEERAPNDWNGEIEKKIENEELAVVLEKCIASLPEKYAIVFRMKTINQMETEDICKELDITSSNLWVIIHRARTQLRKCMEDNWFKK